MFRRLSLHWSESTQVVRIAYPVILGMLSYSLLSFADTAMLGRLGPAPQATSGVAGVLFFAIVFTLAAIGVGIQTLTARRFGEGNLTECGPVLNSGLVLALVLGLPLTVAAPWIARFAAPLLSSDPEVATLSEIYLGVRLYGSVAMIASWSLQGFFAGIGETHHQMVAAIVTTVTNIALDYALIFGRLGLPRMETRGAALASTIAVFAGLAYLLVVALLPRHRQRFAILKAPIPFRRWVAPIVRLSLPAVAQRALSNGSWFAFFLILGRIGTVELAASTALRSVYHLTIMVGVGMGTAAASLIGRKLGADRPEEAERLGWEAAKLAAYAMAALGILFIALPVPILRIFTNDPSVIAAGRAPLFVLGFVQAFAGVALVLTQGLQGAGNTRFVMLAELVVCGTLYLPVVYLLGVRADLGILGAWTGEYVYWISLAAIMSWKFARGDWKRIVV